MISENVPEWEHLTLSWTKWEMLHIGTLVCPFHTFFSSSEETLNGFVQQCVCVCAVPACAQSMVLSNSCLMFYALLSESGDTAADSSLSQQPLISIALSFNLPSSVSLFHWAYLYYTSPRSAASWFLLHNPAFELISLFTSVLQGDAPFNHIRVSYYCSSCFLLFILPSSAIRKVTFQIATTGGSQNTSCLMKDQMTSSLEISTSD